MAEERQVMLATTTLSTRSLVSRSRFDSVNSSMLIEVVTAFLVSIPARLSSLSVPHKDRTTNKSIKQAEVTVLTSELQSQINTLLAFTSGTSNTLHLAVKKDELWDKKGTELWNLCTRLQRSAGHHGQGDGFLVAEAVEKQSSTSYTSLLALARLLAFLFIDCSFRASVKARRKAGKRETDEDNYEQGDLSQITRLMKISIKTARLCLEHQHTDLASKVLERAAAYEDNLSRDRAVAGVNRSTESDDQDRETYLRLRLDYLGLRMLLVRTLVLP